MSDLVSIVITLYNKERFVEAALLSALHQTYKNKEIIVVNDGSTDSSLNIVTKYQNQIRLFSQPNQGVAAANNFGIRQAKGKWIKHLDADDLLEPDAIEKMMELVDQTPNAEDTFFYTHFKYIDAHGNLLYVFYEKDRHPSELMHVYYTNWNTALYSKKLFEEIGDFDEELKWANDYDWLLRLVYKHHKPMKVLDLFTASYRKWEGMLSSSAPPFWLEKVSMRFRMQNQ